MNILSFLLGRPIKAQRQPSALSADPAELPQLEAYYQTHLAPIAMGYETKRVACLKATRKRLYLSLLIVLGLVLLAVVESWPCSVFSAAAGISGPKPMELCSHSTI